MDKSEISQLGIRYGIITSAGLIVYSVVLQAAGYGNDNTLSLLSYLILAIGIYMGHQAFKDRGDGFMSYGEGLGLGMIISSLSGVFLGIFTYIYIKFIDQSTVEIAIEEARIQLEEQGLDDEVIDQAMALTEQFLTPGWLGFFGFMGLVIVGFILCLIISAITKRTNPEAEF